MTQPHSVLAPFCGCGTPIDPAGERGCRQIGTDITALAIFLIKNRPLGTYDSRTKRRRSGTAARQGIQGIQGIQIDSRHAQYYPPNR